MKIHRLGAGRPRTWRNCIFIFYDLHDFYVFYIFLRDFLSLRILFLLIRKSSEKVGEARQNLAKLSRNVAKLDDLAKLGETLRNLAKSGETNTACEKCAFCISYKEC